MATYFFVFGVVLRTRFGADTSRSGFVLYFLAGMLPWLAFSEAIGRAPSVIVDHRNFVKKLVFPLETLPVNLVSSGFVTEVFALVIFALFVLFARGGLPVTALWLPALVDPATAADSGTVLVPGRPRRVRPRPRAGHWVRFDTLVLPDSDLLSGHGVTAALATHFGKEPNLHAR